MDFKENGEYTVVDISSMLAMTTKIEIKIKSFQENGEPIFVLRGKRKLKVLADEWKTRALVFEGWDLPLKIDSDQRENSGSYTMCGNACYNFLGTPEFVREFIEKNNLNEYFARKDSILAHGETVSSGRDGTPVFPEAPTEHAVVKKIREKLGMNKAPEVIFSYSRNEAKADGVLMDNPKRENFGECDIITTNLFNQIKGFATERNRKRIEPIDENYLIGCLMLNAKDIYENKKFEGEDNEDFFVIPETNDGFSKVWFVRNENARLTAMLPEDY